MTSASNPSRATLHDTFQLSPFAATGEPDFCYWNDPKSKSGQHISIALHENPRGRNHQSSQNWLVASPADFGQLFFASPQGETSRFDHPWGPWILE